MSFVMAFTRHGDPWFERMDTLDECFELMWTLEDCDRDVYDRYGVLDFIFGSDGTGEATDIFIFLSRGVAKKRLAEYKTRMSAEQLNMETL